MLLGAHVSAAGGLSTAFERAEEVGCRSMQIFTKNKGAWAAKALEADDLEAFRARDSASPVECVVAHAAYLLNIASPSTETREKSLGALRVELERCEALGIPYLVLHPGSHMGEGERAGLRRVVRALDRVHRETPGFRSMILLETSAGQGSSVCCRFESLAAIFGDVRQPDRLGVCVDTCHIFAAGYELRDDEGYSRTLEELSRHVGLETVRCLHLNDSKRELGSRVDRHDHIGRGQLGKPVFRRVLNDPRLQGRPMIIELPPDDGMLQKNLEELRRLVAKSPKLNRAKGGRPRPRRPGRRAPAASPRPRREDPPR